MVARALPFALPFLFVPMLLAAAAWGGWWLLLVPVTGYVLVSLLDRATGPLPDAPSPDLPDERLLWHRALTWAWVPVQLALVPVIIGAAARPGHLALHESLALAVGLGIVTGGVGITYAHELIHQRNRGERLLGRLLLGSVLYGQFETGHLHVHHPHVGTPRDPVTARYNEGFHRFLWRVVRGTLSGAWAVERARLARRGRPVWHPANPFWQYGGLALLFVGLAAAAGGAFGVLLLLVQAAVAVVQLELVNYVEHYGLTRKHLGDGRYEPVRPHHSWNAAQKGSNWFLINLQLHSDHHVRPDRRYPNLANRSEAEAPRLPYGYPLMCLLAAIPPVWRRMMNPRVRAWRRRWYPEITDWTPYKLGLTPVRE